MLYKGVKIEEIIKSLKTDENRGLSDIEAQKRLKEYGPNEFAKEKKFSALKLFIKQFYDFLTLLLIVSTIIAFFVGKIETAIAIGIIIFINVPLGFWMEYKAEKELKALKKMLKSQARVIRDGVERLIDYSLIVPGDIIIIEEGQKIPADARLIEESNLKINEASLTGESVPVEKDIVEIKGKDNANLIFLGTIVMTGFAKAVVIATGKNTEFGKIAQSLAEIKQPLAPLQKQVTKLGKAISLFALILAIFILILLHLRGLSFWDAEQLKLALSIFISVVPASLILVMTLTLAVGVKKMAQEKVIVKQLSSVETLGSTQIICTDKTGTLTENKMTIKKIWTTADLFFDIGESVDIGKIGPYSDLAHLIKSGVICNSANISRNKDRGWDTVGDPTEVSLLILGEKAGFNEQKIKKGGKIFDFPFEQKLRRRMTIFENLENKEVTLISIGAPENVLAVSSYYLMNGKAQKIDKNYRDLVEKRFLSLAAEGYRVIGLASKKIDKADEYDRTKLEKEITLIGLAALYDPPRAEIKQAIQECKSAGIKIVMITGDNSLTAMAIAKEINLSTVENGQERIIVGADIEKMDDDYLLRVVDNYDIFARTTPLHKLRIVKAFQKKGYIVAVTGDGVNDAPALKEADIGAAMGIRGTDVSKEAAEIIVTDDDFSSIAKAVKQGRRIYANIKKFIQFLFTANLIEFPLIMTALIVGIPMPITALQILWINFVTDSMPALTLGVEPGTGDIMKRKPRSPKEHILKGIFSFIFFASFIGYIFALTLFCYLYFILSKDLIFAQTMTFTFIVIYKLFLVFATRANTKTIFELGVFTNKLMVWAVLFSFALQLIIIHVVLLHDIFNTTFLTLSNWVLIFILSIFAVTLIELKKILFRKKRALLS